MPDTVRMPWESTQMPDAKVVPPSLAVLFRVAVGPGADYYVPRFLRFERTGWAAPGWHWPAMLAPCVWAFYRKLWVTGIAYALLPLLGAAVFVAIEPALEDSLIAWVASAAVLIWLIPGAIAALFANSLLYHRVRRLVRRAETVCREKSAVARFLTGRSPTDFVLAAASALIATIALSLVMPRIEAMYQDRAVRAQLAQSLAAIIPLQRQIEDSWQRASAMPLSLDQAAALARTGGNLIDSVSFNPINGRLRLALGPTIADLSGKNILLAPTVDPWQRLQWVCIPVDIASKYLPLQCRQS